MERFLPSDINSDNFKKILDYGGEGGKGIPPLLRKSDCYVYDISTTVPEDYATKIQDINGYGKFDFISVLWVLEHVSYPNDIIQEIKQVCTKDTVILLTVPLETIDETHPPRFNTSFHEHINFFTSHSTETLMKRNGFSIIKMELIDTEFPNGTDRSIFVLAKPNW